MSPEHLLVVAMMLPPMWLATGLWWRVRRFECDLGVESIGPARVLGEAGEPP